MGGMGPLGKHETSGLRINAAIVRTVLYRSQTVWFHNNSGGWAIDSGL